MSDQLPDILLRHRYALGITAIFVAIATWAVDLTGRVYACPYCRVQRTAIGLLGILFLLPNPAHWIVRYLSAVIAVFGLGVAGNQHFMNWARILSGEFSWGEQWYVNPWLLSGAALFILTAQVLLLWRYRSAQD